MEVNGVSQGRLNLNTGTLQQQSAVEIKTSDSSDTNQQAKLSEKEVSKAVDKLNKLFEDKGTYVQYEVYGKFHNISIKILDEKTNEVIKEIPPKKLVEMVEKLCEMAGILVDEKA